MGKKHLLFVAAVLRHDAHSAMGLTRRAVLNRPSGLKPEPWPNEAYEAAFVGRESEPTILTRATDESRIKAISTIARVQFWIMMLTKTMCAKRRVMVGSLDTTEYITGASP